LSLLVWKMDPLDSILYAFDSNRPLWDHYLYTKIKFLWMRIYLWLHFLQVEDYILLKTLDDLEK
jgi:hypothetical protein